MSSRLKMTARNAFWSYFSMFVSFGLQFISRTVFIYCLGEEYLGINGLFSNVLGVLSFACLLYTSRQPDFCHRIRGEESCPESDR